MPGCRAAVRAGGAAGAAAGGATTGRLGGGAAMVALLLAAGGGMGAGGVAIAADDGGAGVVASVDGATIDGTTRGAGFGAAATCAGGGTATGAGAAAMGGATGADSGVDITGALAIGALGSGARATVGGVVVGVGTASAVTEAGSLNFWAGALVATLAALAWAGALAGAATLAVAGAFNRVGLLVEAVDLPVVVLVAGLVRSASSIAPRLTSTEGRGPPLTSVCPWAAVATKEAPAKIIASPSRYATFLASVTGRDHTE